MAEEKSEYAPISPIGNNPGITIGEQNKIGRREFLIGGAAVAAATVGGAVVANEVGIVGLIKKLFHRNNPTNKQAPQPNATPTPNEGQIIQERIHGTPPATPTTESATPPSTVPASILEPTPPLMTDPNLFQQPTTTPEATPNGLQIADDLRAQKDATNVAQEATREAMDNQTPIPTETLTTVNMDATAQANETLNPTPSTPTPDATPGSAIRAEVTTRADLKATQTPQAELSTDPNDKAINSFATQYPTQMANVDAALTQTANQPAAPESNVSAMGTAQAYYDNKPTPGNSDQNNTGS